VDNFKQALLAYYNKAKDFLLQKDENSKIKYKNLTVCSIGLLVFILICLMLVPSKQNNNTMMLHPDDVSSANEEVSFADNNAVAVTPTADDETSLQIQNKPQTEASNPTESQKVTDNTPDLQEDEPTENELSNTEENNEINQSQDNHGTFLYCGKYTSTKEASEHKANLAFSAGLISSVVEKSGTYTLKLGPFNSRDNAVKAFEKMDKLSLVDECQLETE
jgi:cell division protein FtsN